MDRRIAQQLHSASQAVSTRIQVAAVLEGLLDDIEVWEWANRVAALEAELRRCRKDLAAARDAESKLNQAQFEAAAKAAADRDAAKSLRDTFVRELWLLSKEMKERDAERRELAELSEQVQRVPQLEEDLQTAQRQLARAQARSPSLSGLPTTTTTQQANSENRLSKTSNENHFKPVDSAEHATRNDRNASADRSQMQQRQQQPLPPLPAASAALPPAAAATANGGIAPLSAHSSQDPAENDSTSIPTQPAVAAAGGPLTESASADAAGGQQAAAAAAASEPQIQKKNSARRKRKPRPLGQKCALLKLDDKALLRVYSLLDSEAVLNTAYLCRAMYRKVNALFGIGDQTPLLDQSNKDDDEQFSGTESETENGISENRAASAAAAAPSAPAVEPLLLQSASSKPSAAVAANALVTTTPNINSSGGGGKASPSGALGSSLAARAIGLAPQALVAGLFSSVVGKTENFGPTASVGAAEKAAGSAAAAGGGGGGFSAPAGAALSGADGKVASGQKEQQQQQVVPASAMAQLGALSSKLTLSEARGIITLTERMRSLDKELSATRVEKEDIFARLQGSEQVKDFLVEKLKETEAALKRSLDDKGRAERQSATDQEVIGFLDAKMQEAERVAQESTTKALRLQGELDDEKKANKQRIQVLEDSLRLEKQRTEEFEERSRKERRLLVQEVKKLRALNAAALGETESYRRQVNELRESIKSLGR